MKPLLLFVLLFAVARAQVEQEPVREEHRVPYIAATGSDRFVRFSGPGVHVLNGVESEYPESSTRYIHTSLIEDVSAYGENACQLTMKEGLQTIVTTEQACKEVRQAISASKGQNY